jgi:hypothetical protein
MSPFPGATYVDPLVTVDWNMRNDEVAALHAEIERLRARVLETEGRDQAKHWPAGMTR